jgi:hypothetical protein
MSKFHITAGRLATQTTGDSFWANFASLAFREHNDQIMPGRLKPKEADIGLVATKWFWNGEQCCNPWLRRF